MATLTTNWQYLGQAYIGTSRGNLYVRIYAKYTEQDISNNRSYVQYEARAYYENSAYILDEQGSIAVSGTGASYKSKACTRPTTGETNAITTEGWVYHNADGTQSISCSGTINFPNWGWSNTAYGSASLPTIPRQANITNSPATFTDESNPWFSYENKANAPMSCWLEPNPNGEHLCGRTLSGTSGTYTWNLTEDERNQLRRKCTGKSCTVRIGLYSTVGGNTYVSYHDRTMTIVNGEPTFTDYTYQDINTNTLELTGNAETIIKGYSKLKVSISNENKAIVNKESSMSYYKVDEVKGDYSATDTVELVVDKYDKKTITCLAVDSRGYSKTVEKNIENFIEYVEIIKNSLSLTRSDNGVGEFVNLSFSGSFWNGNFGAINNDLTITYRYKKTTDTEYINGTTTILPTINENTFSFDNLIAGNTEQKGFNINDSYDIEVIVEDKLNKVIYSNVIGAGIPAIAVYKNKVALGDKYDVSLGGIQLWGDIYVNGKKISGKGTEE